VADLNRKLRPGLRHEILCHSTENRSIERSGATPSAARSLVKVVASSYENKV
jgi:hypothetical protein